jgi:predicted ATPase
VQFAPLVDPSLVPQAVASVLGVREQPGRSLTETLSHYLRNRELLLVLDNCEHLIEACADLAETLLRSCPELRVLATSREALSIVGEVAWPVPSLSLPDFALSTASWGSTRAPRLLASPSSTASSDDGRSFDDQLSISWRSSYRPC